MGRRSKLAEASRKRAFARVRKMRGLFRGKPSLLDYLLKDRKKSLQEEEQRLPKRELRNQ